MNLSFLPKRLVVFCNLMVKQHHKVHGYSGLSDYLWHKDTMVFMAIHEDLLALINGGLSRCPRFINI